MPKSIAICVYALTLAFFGAFFIWPIWQILQGGFFDADQFTMKYVVEVFRNPIYLEGLRNSFGVAVFSTLLSALIAVPLAFIADRFEFPGKKIFMGLVLLPIMLPPFVGAIGVKQMFGQTGAVNAVLHHLGILATDQTIDWLGQGQFWGVVVVTALGLYPILYLNAVASLANIDPAMEEAAENLGCTGFKRFFKITLPLMRPGLFAGCTIVFIWAFTELGVPLIFDYSRLTSVQIFFGIKDIGGSPFPYALVSVMLFFSILFYAIGKGLFGRHTFSMMAKAGHAGGAKKPGVLGQAICVGIFGVVVFIALLPHMGVILVAFASDWYGTVIPQEWTMRNFELALGHPLTVSSIQNSLFYAGVATMLNITIGVLIAFVVVRTRLPGRHALDTMAMLPLAVPGIVMAFGYLAMSQEGKFFSFINAVENPTVLLIIAYAVRKLPFVVRSAVAGLQTSSETYEEAAQNLGARPLTTARRITLPLILANLLAGGLLAFSQSMLEVSDSLILAQQAQYYPITKAIYELMQFLGDGRFIASALGVWAMAFLAVTIIGASLLLGKKLGAIFRV
ncbi:MAG: iron ABC transporter permease [Opitutales bacterium]|nr:iron ABC transporter permease [Opitutales bacterium]